MNRCQPLLPIGEAEGKPDQHEGERMLAVLAEVGMGTQAGRTERCEGDGGGEEMTPEKYIKVKEVFLQAAEKPIGEREGFLREAAGEDEEMSLGLRKAERIGRPVGAADFLEGLERDSGRVLQRGRPGPKPALAGS